MRMDVGARDVAREVLRASGVAPGLLVVRAGIVRRRRQTVMLTDHSPHPWLAGVVLFTWWWTPNNVCVCADTVLTLQE